jgi:flagellar export protein FliJ
MSGLRTLIDLAHRRSNGALAAWQRLRTECDEARQKLTLLKGHAERYRDLLHVQLRQGMTATSTNAYLGFIGQIEEVVVRQESEIGSLEQACARQWQELVDARREKRIYEILNERAAAREQTAAARRGRAELDQLLQCFGQTP